MPGLALLTPQIKADASKSKVMAGHSGAQKSVLIIGLSAGKVMERLTL